jgi:hypothetical protein
MTRVYGLSMRPNFVSKFWGQPSWDTIFCLARAFAWVNPSGTAVTWRCGAYLAQLSTRGQSSTSSKMEREPNAGGTSDLRW